ncbi:MAG: Aminomethyltransferase folate-binding domain [Thermoleophilaceae bacterium]|nr:Aminomethyltransferase folate-binding domain [Thermoleophilaceae bacterium]
MVQRDGVPVVGHYGSVSAEIAVCTKAAGLVDRSGIRQLAVTGPEPLLDHVLAATVPGTAPASGQARSIAGTWCCRPSARRALIAGGPSAVTRWRRVVSRAISSAGLAVIVEQLPDSAALSLIGPRSARIIEGVGLPSGMAVGGLADGHVAESAVTVVREDGDHFLLLFEQGHPNAVWQALWEAGGEYGLAPVGNEALELLQAAHRPLD